MSTRATVTVKEDGKVLARFYHHSDGYPSWLGVKLAEFIESGEFVNGLGGGDKLQFNGGGCFAAALIKHFKVGAGGVYMIPSAQKEEWNYTVEIAHPNAQPGAAWDNSAPEVRITARGYENFNSGPVADFKEWAKHDGKSSQLPVRSPRRTIRVED